MDKKSMSSCETNAGETTTSQVYGGDGKEIMPKLFGPSIEGVNNNTVWVVDLPDPVLIDIFPWEEMLDGDVVELTLSGRDAAGDLVADKTLRHTLSGIDVGQKLVFEVNKADISVYGENGHVGETGTLVMFYTVNGLRSPETIFSVHGVEGSDTYTLHATVKTNNSPADGASFNTVAWTVTNQAGTEVQGLAATASVTGSALIIVNGVATENMQVALPATLNYVDSSAEGVNATVALNDFAISASAPLLFSADSGAECKTFQNQTAGYYSLAQFLSAFDVQSGIRYKLTISSSGNEAIINVCPSGFYFDESAGICAQGAPDYSLTGVSDSGGSEAYFIKPSSGTGLTSNGYFVFFNDVTDVTICIERA